jgi:large repetitive protein
MVKSIHINQVVERIAGFSRCFSLQRLQRNLPAAMLLTFILWFAGHTPATAQLKVPAIPSNSQLANQYEYSAEYVYRVNLDGGYLEDGTIIAYVGDQIRGAQSASELFTPTGAYVYKVRLHSNSPSGETVTFRYFDVFDEKVYEITETEAFIADAVPDYYSPTVLNAVCGPPGKATGLLPEDGSADRDATLDLFWQPADNTLYYKLFLWKEGDTEPSTPRNTNISGTSIRVSGLTYGSTYHWYIVSANQCLEDTSVTHTFTVRNLPDLVVTSMTAVDTILSATAFQVQITVKNQGTGATPATTWYDAVYLSADQNYSGSDRLLKQEARLRALAPDSSYTQVITVSVPAEYEGDYYLLGQTDRTNSIAETDNSNNFAQSPLPLHVAKKPLPDVKVGGIAANSFSYDPGDTIDVSWRVDNIGNAAASGGWTEKVSIVSLSGIRQNLTGTPQYTGVLGQGDGVDRNFRFVLPALIGFEGEAHVEVELVPSNELVEYPENRANNKAASLARITVGNRLYIEIPGEASEAYTGQLRSYVRRSGNLTQALTVNLTASEAGQINLPASVTIPERSSSALFNITMIDNSTLEGSREVAVEASATGYDPQTATLTVLDNEKSAVVLALDKTAAVEGDTLVLTVSRDLVTADSVVVLLSTNATAQWTFPAQVVLGAGAAEAQVPVFVTDNTVPELNAEATITGRSGGMIAGSVTALIIDNDIPEIEFEIRTDTVAEGAGPYATFGLIRRVGSSTGEIRVILSASLANTIYFPSPVVLPAGVKEREFNIGVVDNDQVDGFRTVEITGSIYIPSCNCGTTPENGGVVTGTLTVADNDGPSLKVAVNPVTLKEGVTGAGKVTVTRNTPTTNSLNIMLSSSDTSELEIPATAVIPAGSASVEVSVDTKDDGIDDGSQMVTIRASATDFSPGIAWVNVTDINRPDLEMGAPVIPSGEIVTGRQLEIRATIVNNGYGKAPSGVPVKYYLSKDDRLDSKDQEIHEGTLADPLGIGASVEYRVPVTVPGETGDYYLIGKVNPESTVTELLYINNESPAVALTIIPSYNGTAVVDEEVFTAPVPVTIRGSAALINGDPAINADLDVYVISGSLRRVLEVTTDENGGFTTVFEPYAYEAGRYIVGACYPGQGLSVEQDAFDIMGMERSSKGYLTWNIKREVPETGTIGIRNRSSVPLTEVTFEPLNVPDGMNLMIDTIPVLGGHELENFNFTIYGEVITEGLNYVEVPVRVSSAEGISFEFKAYYYCQALGSHLVSTPASINTTITKDKARYYDLRIVNEGAGETGRLTVALPAQEWMSVASADTIENLLPGDTTIVTLLFTPDGDVPLNTPMSGRIVLHNSNGNDLPIPYRVEAVSEETGGLRVDVVDEYTYFTEAAPHVQNAHVVVRHPFSGRIVAEGFTGADGIFEVDSLPEGSYKMTVQADKHEGYQNIVEIDPGRVNEQTVFLAFQAITYTWEVVPTEIEDSYEVELIMEFETNVPAPVVVMEMPKEMPQLFNDETYTFLVTITNKGLITAEDVELRFPENDPEYEWVTQYSTMDLVAQQAIQVPVTMRIRDGVKKSEDSFKKSGSKSSGPCSDYAMTFYGFECGPDRQWRQAGALFTISGRVCLGDGGGGGGFYIPWGTGGSGPGGPGGGGTTYDPYGGTASTVSPSMGCDPCLNSVLMTILGCVGPPIGAALSCGYGFVDGDASWMDIGACIPGPIGCTIGVIGTIETCYNTPPFGMGGGSSGGKKALDDLAAKGTKVPPIMYQAAIELDYAMMNDQAERDYVSEYFGNSMDWTVKENFRDFTVVTDSVVTNQVPFDAATIARVKDAMEDTDISESEIDAFVARWNMTMAAWGAGVRTPNATYPDMINRDSLDSYYNKMQVALDYALSLGYLSVSDMKYKAWYTLKESTEQSGSSVCASVSIRISQKLVMTREAFEGTLTIFNGNTTTAMEEIELNIEIRDEYGVLSNDLFEIETKALDILTGVDGTGSLGAEQTGSATILFIPEKGAAPEVPVSYSFGGSFSYLDPFTDVTVEKPLFPVTLDVNPSPDLFLHYFMQRDILGDDPLTDPIEPVIPAELAVMIENNGYGTAKNVRIESAQPEIIDNEKGLSIHFELIGSNLNGQPDSSDSQTSISGTLRQSRPRSDSGGSPAVCSDTL